MLKHVKTKILIMFLAISLACFFFGFASLPTSKADPADVTVTIDTGQVIGTNSFQIGFALDEGGISYWKGSSIARSYSEVNNYKMVRFFEHRLGKPCTYWNEGTKTGTWDWTAVDDLLTKMLAQGIEPMVCLGKYYSGSDRLTSAPNGMGTNYAGTNLPNPEQWAAYTADWVEHFDNVGLAVIYYEIFNEPQQYFGWTGSNTARRNAFATFFNEAVDAMRAVNPNIKIGNDNSMIQSNSFNEWIANNLRTLDFLSWHPYLTGSISTSDSTLIYKAQYDEGGTYGANNFIEPARQDYYNIKGVWLDCIPTEENLNWAWDPSADPRIHEIVNAITEALRYRTYILNGHVTNTVYWEFAAQSTGFGTVNRYTDFRYPTYWLHNIMFSDELGALSVGDDILTSSSTSSKVVPLVWKHGDTTNILLIHSSTTARSVALSGVSGTYSYSKINDDNPDIQSGSMDVGNEINFDDYTVMLLQQESGGEPDNPPSNSDIAHNTTIAGNPIEFSCNWTDDNGLSGYIFGTNNTGPWQNETFASLTGTQDWANVTTTLNSTADVVVQYRWYCNDSANQWTTSSINSLVTEASSNIPVYSNVGTTSNINGSSCKFFVKWNDIEGLSGFIFGTNNTGSWVNETWTSLSGVEDWSEVTKTLNGTVGTLIQWQVWCNDTDNHWTVTEEFFLITEEETTENLLFFETKTPLDYNENLEDNNDPFLYDANGTIKTLSYSSTYSSLSFTVTSSTSTSYTQVQTAGKGEPTHISGASYTYDAGSDILTLTVTHSSDVYVAMDWISGSGGIQILFGSGSTLTFQGYSNIDFQCVTGIWNGTNATISFSVDSGSISFIPVDNCTLDIGTVADRDFMVEVSGASLTKSEGNYTATILSGPRVTITWRFLPWSVIDNYFMLGVGLTGIIMLIAGPTWFARTFIKHGLDSDTIEHLGYGMLMVIMGFGFMVVWLWPG